MKAKCYASKSASSKLEYLEFDRREPNEHDVEFEVKFCGVCHSDIHTARGDWGEIEYPCVPGHEIVGIVTRVGSEVKDFKPGDRVGVGCMVNSCGECEPCKNNLENYCDNDPTWTYSSTDPIDGTDTKGGYSTIMVAPEKFVMAIPDSLELADAAPLLCAGITMYSPLRHWGAKKGMKIGILGLGGLGHMGVKYAKAMGAEVHVITSSPNKEEAALKYGADGVIISTDNVAVESARRKFDLIIDTIPGEHDLGIYLDMLNVDGTMVQVGPIATDLTFNALLQRRTSIAGSGIGSVSETKEMLKFSAERGIVPDIEVIDISKINEAWDNMVAKQMSHRYVIDMEKSFKS
jgi:alcohol dehydrogenase (NADP+)